jgi:hypothetical protein
MLSGPDCIGPRLLVYKCDVCVLCQKDLKKSRIDRKNYLLLITIKYKTMSNASKQPTQKVDIEKSAKTEEYKAKVFAKSDWPKNSKRIYQISRNYGVKFFCL